MRKITVLFAVLVLLLVAPGCVMIPKESEIQLRDAAAVSAATMGQWDKLTPQERHEAHWKLTRAFQTLNNSLLNEPFPAEFQTGVYEGPPPVEELLPGWTPPPPPEEDDVLDEGTSDGGDQ